MSQEVPLASSKRIRADLILLFVSLIWGSAFVVQRVAATHMNVFLFNGTRFLLGAVVLLPLQWYTRRTNDIPRGLDRRTLLGIILAGIVLFCGADLQTLGMRYTTQQCWIYHRFICGYGANPVGCWSGDNVSPAILVSLPGWQL
jgi:hypothetical protein